MKKLLAGGIEENLVAIVGYTVPEAEQGLQGFGAAITAAEADESDTSAFEFLIRFINASVSRKAAAMLAPWVAKLDGYGSEAMPWLGGQTASDLLDQLLMLSLEELESGQDGIAAGKEAAGVSELGKEVMTFMVTDVLPQLLARRRRLDNEAAATEAATATAAIVAAAAAKEAATSDAAAGPDHRPGLDAALYEALWGQRLQSSAAAADAEPDPAAPDTHTWARASPPLAPRWYARADNTCDALAEATLLLRAQAAIQQALSRAGDGPALAVHTSPLPAATDIIAYAEGQGWLHLDTMTDPTRAAAALKRGELAVYNELLAPMEQESGPRGGGPQVRAAERGGRPARRPLLDGCRARLRMDPRARTGLQPALRKRAHPDALRPTPQRRLDRHCACRSSRGGDGTDQLLDPPARDTAEHDQQRHLRRMLPASGAALVGRGHPP